MGKGSGRRPQKVSQEQLQDNWERIFSKKKEKDGKNESDTTDITKAKDRWLDDSSDC